MRRFLLAVDDFYPDPDRVRAEALRAEYFEPDDLVGWRTKPYRPPGVRARIEKLLRARVTLWPDDTEDILTGNGCFFIGLSRGSRAETPGVHFDNPAIPVTAVVYLTPGAALDTGTSLWRHGPTGLTAKPTPADARRLGASVADLCDLINHDGTNPRKWDEIDRVGNVYNRAVFYHSRLLHSATRHFGTNLRNGRIYQTFGFAADLR
ncbi:MAG TPA: DUF6445 family protein [Pyrinomonadaceae bacterium]|nr:DUF6445 family protein [Pyrinomonadaceae bacterium]